MFYESLIDNNCITCHWLYINRFYSTICFFLVVWVTSYRYREQLTACCNVSSFFSQQAVLQYYSDVIEGALQERLRNRGRQGETRGKAEEEEEEEVEDERASTPTDLREIDF